MSDAHQHDPTDEAPAPDPAAGPTAAPDPEAPAADGAAASAEGAPADDAPADEASADEAAAAEDPRSRAELLAALREAERQRDEFLDDLRRARAEFENFRKRSMREGATQRDAGKAAMVESLLDVLDDLDRTLEAAAASEDESLSKGVELVAGKLVQALRDHDLQRVDETGVPFDPNRHEAVQQTEADETLDEPRVAQVLRPGYLLGDRVVRAAMVVVEQ